MESVVATQLQSLDDTDYYSSAWTEALLKASEDVRLVKWGGRGQGGRGLSRRTFQPRDIVVDNVNLEYSGSEQGSFRMLLEGATLKLLSGRVYCLIGRNGSGKSSLLKRIHAGRIPGFPPHIVTLYIPQELVLSDSHLSALGFVAQKGIENSKLSSSSIQAEMKQLEEKLDQLQADDDDQEGVEDLVNQIAELDESLDNPNDAQDMLLQAEEALAFMGLDALFWNVPVGLLSPGMKKKTALALALVCRSDLILMDEPSSHLDVPGLIQLRQLIDLCSSHGTTVLMVSHDSDLVNDMATNIVDLRQAKLLYYPGNYVDYQISRQQSDLHTLRQSVELDKKRSSMMRALENLKKQVPAKGGGPRKKSDQIDVLRKKIEREGLNVDQKGHRWKQTKAGMESKPGAINALDASTRRGLTTQELLKLTEKSLRPPPDKAVQFSFRNPESKWFEPLIMAIDVGLKCNDSLFAAQETSHQGVAITKDGFLFDCIDFSVDEGQRYCIVGENGCGKSALLKILGRLEASTEGHVKHALNVDVGFMDQNFVDNMMLSQSSRSALEFLASRYPLKSEQDLRGELTNFGLSPRQATTNIAYLSGGERRRLYLADLMLGKAQVLLLDQPTSDLDMESVEAFIYGLSRWSGTMVMVSHDAYLIRSLYANVFALVDGKLQRVEGGIDTYLRSFA